MAMDAGKSVGWDFDVRSGRNVWFGDLRSMFGISSDGFVGEAGDLYRYVHTEDRQRVSEAMLKSRQTRTPYAAEFRVVWPDGTTRWVAARGNHEYARNGDAVRMLGMAVDITERKKAEEALASVSGKLIEAHEEERTWIARELHDDINQRVALLAATLENLRQGRSSSENPGSRSFEDVQKLVQEIGNDIQALSHRLHSSKLEYLGLEVASAGFCRELSERQRVEIEFHSESVPKGLSQEISLCLFRVLQEALQNAVKHSGARHFDVSLRDGKGEVELTVHDSGAGFDPEKAIDGQGLGLTSMKERLKLVDGQLFIDSKPQQGTTIHARVPLHPQIKSARAAG